MQAWGSMPLSWSLIRDLEVELHRIGTQVFADDVTERAGLGGFGACDLSPEMTLRITQ
jgi:hypothetical protein